jgi:serine phosphatase RsbU (regulator of sigma subunit)
MDSILSGLEEIRFQETKGVVPNFGMTELQYWFCFKLQNHSSEQFNLTTFIKYPLLDDIEYFDVYTDGTYKSHSQGRFYPRAERESNYRGFAHKISLFPNEIRTIYVRVGTQSSMSVPLYIATDRDFDDFVGEDYILQGIYFGIVGVMAIYNLFVFFLVRDRAYIFYVIYLIFGSILFQLSLNGLIPIFFFPNTPLLVVNGHNIFYFLFLFFTFPMIISFMNLKENSPLANRIHYTLLVFPVIAILLLPFLPYRVMNQTGDIFSMGLAIISFITAYYIAFVAKYRPAYFFFFAFLFVIVGGVSTLLKYMGVVPVNIFTENAFQISMAIEVIFMAFGLGDRIALVRKEKEKIQYRAEINKQKLNAFQKELLLAQKLQESTLPSKLPYHPGIKILTGYRPASLVGGDFYDIVKLNESEISCLIADVTGHGVPAAIEAAMLKIAYTQALRFASSPGLILEKINRSLVGTYKNQLLTASSFYLNLETKSLTIANAGHPPLYLFREASHTIESIRPPGKLIGYSRELAYPEEEHSLQSNDRILLYTDGLWEIWERDELGDKTLEDGSGETNLISWLYEHWHLGMEDLTSAMENFITRRSRKSPPEDDITYILFKIS